MGQGKVVMIISEPRAWSKFGCYSFTVVDFLHLLFADPGALETESIRRSPVSICATTGDALFNLNSLRSDYRLH